MVNYDSTKIFHEVKQSLINTLSDFNKEIIEVLMEMLCGTTIVNGCFLKKLSSSNIYSMN